MPNGESGASLGPPPSLTIPGFGGISFVAPGVPRFTPIPPSERPPPTTPPPDEPTAPPPGEGPEEIFPDTIFLPPFGIAGEGPEVGRPTQQPTIAEACSIDPVFAQQNREICNLLGIPTPLEVLPAGSFEAPTEIRRDVPLFEGLFEPRPGIREPEPPPEIITDEELAEVLFRGPIPRPMPGTRIPRLPTTREELQRLLRRLGRIGRIIFPGGPEVLTEIPELFPVRLPERRRRALPQPRTAPVGPPAPTPDQPLPEIITTPQTAPPRAPAFPRARATVLGRISLAAGAGLASAVGINLLQRAGLRTPARIGEPFSPTTPAPPVPEIPIPPGLAPAGSRAQLRTRQRECQEVKRRRRRKGKCREGFFEELPGRTRFTTWREVDCVTRRNVRSNPLRGI